MTETVSPVESPVKVGDFFVESWGYDQTNVDFYKVVGLTPSGKSVKIQHWNMAHTDERGGPIEHVVPGGEPVTGAWVRVEGGWSEYDRSAIAPVETKRLKVYTDHNGKPCASIKTRSFSWASLWDGKPEYQTGYGWGH